MIGYEFIKRKRLESKISLRSLADLSGLNHTYIKKIEDGVSQPSFEMMLKLLDSLGISVFTFLEVIGHKTIHNDTGNATSERGLRTPNRFDIPVSLAHP